MSRRHLSKVYMQREAPFWIAALNVSLFSGSGGRPEKDKTARQLCNNEEEEITPTHQELAISQ